MLYHKPTLILLREDYKYERLRLKKIWYSKIPLFNIYIRTEIKILAYGIKNINDLINFNDLVFDDNVSLNEARK